jgi:hypothetical protein
MFAVGCGRRYPIAGRREVRLHSEIEAVPAALRRRIERSPCGDSMPRYSPVTV